METVRYTYRLRPGADAVRALVEEWGRCREPRDPVATTALLPDLMERMRAAGLLVEYAVHGPRCRCRSRWTPPRTGSSRRR
jgi:hypothetical protein